MRYLVIYRFLQFSSAYPCTTIGSGFWATCTWQEIHGCQAWQGGDGGSNRKLSEQAGETRREGLQGPTHPFVRAALASSSSRTIFVREAIKVGFLPKVGRCGGYAHAVMHRITGTYIKKDIPCYPKFDWVYLSICIVLVGGLTQRISTIFISAIRRMQS